VSGAEVGINGLTNIVVGGLMLGAALSHVDVDWSVWRIALGILLLISAVAVKVGINLATTSASFWMSSPSPIFAFAIHQAGDLARFPLGIYPLVLKAALGFAIPFAFVSVFPVSFILDTGSSAWLGLFTPLVAAYVLTVGLTIFRRGLRRYESAGN
jgi:ABC-2 type transport system permease protein